MAEYLTTTTSTCRACGRLVPAQVWLQDGGAWFHKSCPEHGRQAARIHSDAAAYLDLGRFHRAGSVPMEFHTRMDRLCPEACGLCPEHEQHVCMPILEITDHCDLGCPICLVKNRSSYHLTRRQVARMLDRLIAAEGQIDVVSLSGGEPALNPEFRGIVEECLGRKEILYVSVSTNGLRLARDESLLGFLAERRVLVALQFDGFRDEVYRALRGRAMVREKLGLIDRIGELGGRMSLTMTVARGINDGECGRVLALLFEREHVCSVMFQPMAYAGRAAAMERPADAVGIPDVLGALDGACGGRVAAADFSPLPCSHPACFALAFYLRVAPGEWVPIKRLTDIDRYLDILQNRALFGTDPDSFQKVREAVYDLWSGPAGAAPHAERALGAIREILRSVECGGGFSADRVARVADRAVKSAFIHAFMDRDTFDLARARKCCNVYPQPDGRLVPCCVHNCLRR